MGQQIALLLPFYLDETPEERKQKLEQLQPIDAMSLYATLFGRDALIEKVHDLLFIDIVHAGDTHKAFAELPFNPVVTTNFDFLLEEGYTAAGKHARPVMYEDQLSLHLPQDVTLLKFHGDMNNPGRMVITEEDYDAVLERYPLVATYLASLLITMTPLFIGYSEEDADFRLIHEVIRDRLGHPPRAYTLQIYRPEDQEINITRFRRRGVEVILLGDDPSKYAQVLTQTFQEMKEYLETKCDPLKSTPAESSRLALSSHKRKG